MRQRTPCPPLPPSRLPATTRRAEWPPERTSTLSLPWWTGQQAVCQYTISNDPKSSVTFEWKGASSPAGATFSPDSGSIAPGATSDTITVTDPFLCPVTFQFVDAGHNLRIDSMFNDPSK